MRRRWLIIGILGILTLSGISIFAFRAEPNKSEPDKPIVNISATAVEQEKAQLPRKGSVWVAYKGQNLYSRPDKASKRAKFLRETPWSGVLKAYLITEIRYIGDDTWYGLLQSERPNGKVLWTPAGEVRVEERRNRIEVNLASRRVEYWEGAIKKDSWPTVIGSRVTPTPVGLHAIQDIMSTDPKGFTGSRMIVLTAYSDVLPSFQGAPPRTALHGRGPGAMKDPLGSARSNGCLRMNNKDIEELARYVQPGDPVYIR
jgi:hypothetical protein